MQTRVIFAILLVASCASAAPSSQPDHSQASSSDSHPPDSAVSQAQGVVVSHGQSAPVQPVVVNQPSQTVEVVSAEQAHHLQPAPHHQGISYYSPAGVIQVVGEQVNKPGVVGPVRSFEQYGQPESASIPANYKPFGSWGLYIGGNPADGYYTNYYKALSNSVDKQQSGDSQVKPAVGGHSAAFSPVLKQAGSSPYVGGDYYPFAYSTSELNSGPRVSVEGGQVGATGVIGSPVVSSVVPSVYSVGGAAVEPGAGLSYSDAFATKKVGAAYAQKEHKEAAGKGHQSRLYVYPSLVAATPAAPHSQQQVVAYPVPVASQIVGSQQGVEGAFNPYGIHAFTRYAVKPALVSSAEQSYHYGVHSPVAHTYPSYKQQGHQTVSHSPVAYQPLNFYGYPLNQLHYSQGSIISPIHHNPEIQHSPVPTGPIEVSASEKAESQDKVQIDKQSQKKA